MYRHTHLTTKQKKTIYTHFTSSYGCLNRDNQFFYDSKPLVCQGSPAKGDVILKISCCQNDFCNVNSPPLPQFPPTSGEFCFNKVNVLQLSLICHFLKQK